MLNQHQRHQLGKKKKRRSRRKKKKEKPYELNVSLFKEIIPIFSVKRDISTMSVGDFFPFTFSFPILRLDEGKKGRVEILDNKMPSS